MDGIIIVSGKTLEELVDSVVDYCADYKKQRLEEDDVNETKTTDDVSDDSDE